MFLLCGIMFASCGDDTAKDEENNATEQQASDNTNVDMSGDVNSSSEGATSETKWEDNAGVTSETKWDNGGEKKGDGESSEGKWD